MLLPPLNTPFCDWITVTYRSERPDLSYITRLFFEGLHASVHPLGGVDSGWSAIGNRRMALTGAGSELTGIPIAQFVTLARFADKSYHLVFQISGLGFQLLRSDPELLRELMGELGSYPHRVTRLDVGMDLPVDGADYLADFKSRFPSGYVQFTRKRAALSWLLSVRDDGRDTGTVYAGKGTRSRVKMRIYDKAYEVLQRRKLTIPPRTRVEFALETEFGASLYDVLRPESLFWHLASPDILGKKPADVPAWFKRESFTPAPRERRYKSDKPPLHVMKSYVDDTQLLDGLIEYVDRNIGSDGRMLLKNHIGRYIDQYDESRKTLLSDKASTTDKAS
ncbi:hypothetical protein BOV80_004772 [Shigella sonnei]|nr:hypothetical protein [Escherichia coli]EFZ2275684.1 hypothetical protein [Shigella sonnei]HEB3767997.1 hypothetical protein [Escherichia coli]